jgi:TatD DNase family protein
MHSRRAATQVLDALEAERGAGTPILHWFTGTTRELDRAIALGCWFSVGPLMLRSAKGRALVSLMPPDRVLTETDAPFAQIDGKPLMPWDVCLAYPDLASLWGCEPSAVPARLRANLRNLVGSK